MLLSLKPLFLVRYMDRNREITRIKRDEIRRLKEHLTLLQQRLERYDLSTFTCWFSQGQLSSSDSHGEWFCHFTRVLCSSVGMPSILTSLFLCFSASYDSPAFSLLSWRYLSYGSGPKRFPLADVLQYAMEFASSKPVCTSPVEDIDSSAPPGGTTGQPPPPWQVSQQMTYFWGHSSSIVSSVCLHLASRWRWSWIKVVCKKGDTRPNESILKGAIIQSPVLRNSSFLDWGNFKNHNVKH